MYQIKSISNPLTSYHPAFGNTYTITLETGLQFEANDDDLIGIFGYYSNVQSLVGRIFAQSEIEMFIL
jgi:hypothetical protein